MIWQNVYSYQSWPELKGIAALRKDFCQCSMLSVCPSHERHGDRKRLGKTSHGTLRLEKVVDEKNLGLLSFHMQAVAWKFCISGNQVYFCLTTGYWSPLDAQNTTRYYAYSGVFFSWYGGRLAHPTPHNSGHPPNPT